MRGGGSRERREMSPARGRNPTPTGGIYPSGFPATVRHHARRLTATLPPEDHMHGLPDRSKRSLRYVSPRRARHRAPEDTYRAASPAVRLVAGKTGRVKSAQMHAQKCVAATAAHRLFRSFFSLQVAGQSTYGVRMVVASYS